MKLFKLFKKNDALPSTHQKLNKMWELWAANNLNSPYVPLMTYQSEVNNGGHSQYFYNVSNCGDLALEVEAVLTILPEPLRNNLALGYATFSNYNEIADDDFDELLDKCDDIFYENEQLIIDIIYQAAKNLTL